MSKVPGYTVGQLAKQAGVSTRTVRYYTAEGLLPPPQTRGRYALYTDDHLLRLQLIKRLKDVYMPLSVIRERLARLSTDAVRQALLDDSLLTPPSNSAADYIAEVLSRPSAQPPKRIIETAGAYQVGPADPALGMAPGSPNALLAHGQISPEMPTARTDAPLYGRIEPLSPPAPQQGQLWRRLVLAPGVELHIHMASGEAEQERIEQLVRLAAELFGRPA